MAGTIPGFSLAQMLDSDGTPLVGGKLYTIQAGTTSTPQTAYQDSGLTLPLSYPVLCDAYGRLPQIFLADGSIKLRLTKANGVQVFVLDGVLVVGASSGGGGGSPVDATTILSTGDLKARYGTGVLSGFVRANGRTIGSSTSGATERANADCQVLFEYLWTADTNLSVSTGRGASAAADWVANKTIVLPDWRGRALAFLDDMGSSAAGRLTATHFGTAATALGAAGGLESNNVILTHNHTASAVAGHRHATVVLGTSNAALSLSNALARFFNDGSVNSYSLGGHTQNADAGLTSEDGGHTPVIQNAGSASAHNIVQPTMLATIYLKL
jgi:hypothetical protein